jgi:hypothetical protein
MWKQGRAICHRGLTEEQPGTADGLAEGKRKKRKRKERKLDNMKERKGREKVQEILGGNNGLLCFHTTWTA